LALRAPARLPYQALGLRHAQGPHLEILRQAKQAARFDKHIVALSALRHTGVFVHPLGLSCRVADGRREKEDKKNYKPSSSVFSQLVHRHGWNFHEKQRLAIARMNLQLSY